jgi:hypothetical protein
MTPRISAKVAFTCILALWTFAATGALHAETLSSWRKDTGTTTTGVTTSTPSLGNGTGTTALNVLISAPITTATLSTTGDVFSLSGTVAFTGLTGTLQHGFRWGVYNTATSSNNNGWLGYYAENSSGSTAGNFQERTNPNTGSWWSATGTSTDSSATANSNAILVDGSYNFNMTFTRTGSNEVTISWSLIGTGSASSYSLSGSFIDTSPQTLTFDRIGVGSAGLSASLIAFSDVTAVYTSAIPEPSTYALFVGLIMLTAGISGRHRLRC